MRLILGLVLAGGALALILVLAAWLADRQIERFAAPWLTENANALPDVDVALVLGAAPIGPEGGPNRYFEYRLDAAAELWRAGKVKYLLVSGDNRRPDYDEPSAMRAGLIARGVPEIGDLSRLRRRPHARFDAAREVGVRPAAADRGQPGLPCRAGDLPRPARRHRGLGLRGARRRSAPTASSPSCGAIRRRCAPGTTSGSTRRRVMPGRRSPSAWTHPIDAAAARLRARCRSVRPARRLRCWC